VHGTDGRPLAVCPSPLTYRMLRSTDFERLVHSRIARSPATRILRATADTLRSTADGAEVRCTGPDDRTLTLRARHVFDSRPRRTLPPARTRLLQHFRGWFVHTGTDRFDPEVADLMDFRVPQPPHGLAFGYVLPMAPDRALVEYIEFSRTPLTTEAYEAALAHYCRDILRLGTFTVESAEQGVIPMTDARFARRVGPAVFRIGTAGGATRPATGYTFAAVQRQSRAIAAALHAGRVDAPPPYGRRALAMDAVMLRAPWTRGASTARDSSRTCSAAYRPNACCASSTVTPHPGRNGASACAPLSAPCSAPRGNCPFCHDARRSSHEPEKTPMTLLRDRELARAFDHASHTYDRLTALNPGYRTDLLRSARRLRLSRPGPACTCWTSAVAPVRPPRLSCGQRHGPGSLPSMPPPGCCAAHWPSRGPTASRSGT
jgi:hypothetical protein